MFSKLLWLAVLSIVTLITALPTSLVEDVKANEIKDTKVKRAHSEIEENPRNPVAYYSNPTAIKRGSAHALGNWNDQKEALDFSPLYTSDEPSFNDKAVMDYDKGYRYASNKEKLDEALENVLNSELFSDPAVLNQYRYYDGSMEESRRKRRSNRNIRLNNRFKREIELTPEEILTLLSIWESERRHAVTPEDYRPLVWTRYDVQNPNDENEIDQDDENWLDSPVVYPHGNNQNRNDFVRGTPSYIYEDKKGQWNGFSENKKKRFMVAKKRNDPTRELRYLNGPPQKNDFYTLSQLLAAQREPNAPMYHRMVL